MPTNFHTIPGQYAGASITPRNIFVSAPLSPDTQAPSWRFINGSLSRDPGDNPTSMLRAGLLIGKITATGLYRPSVYGLNSVTAPASTTSITVNAAVATELARQIVVAGGPVNISVTGPATTGASVATDVVACSAASGTTLTVGATTHTFVIGSAILTDDGSQVPLFVFADSVFGKDVTDINGNSINQTLEAIYLKADLIAEQIINLTADDFGTTTEPSVQAWFKSYLKAGGALNTSGVVYTFSNDR